jgi:sodium transport system ATP-binding protein
LDHPSNPTLGLAGLTKRFGPFVAVRGLTLRVPAGEVYALLGPNGAGKTTALRCLAGLLVPSSGSAHICGIDVAARPQEARRLLAYLSSSMGLYARLSSRELVTFFGELHGLEGSALKERVEAMVGLLELGPFADRLCGKLSTGQRQRVSLARALVHDPPVLILDEPTLGLDVISGQTIHEFIRRERERGKAILFSTHQMEEVELLADRVGILSQGELVAEGRPADIVARTGAPNLARAFLALVTSAAAAERGA